MNATHTTKTVTLSDAARKMTNTTAAKIEKPCKLYQRGVCTDGRDHCYRCGRHLDGAGVCPKGCKDGDA